MAARRLSSSDCRGRLAREAAFRAAATAILTSAGALSAAPASATPPASTATPTAAAEAAAPAEPVVEDVVRAWTIARGWLDGYSLPREHDTEAAVAIRGGRGLSVIIRAGGQIVGRGQAAELDGLSLRRAMAAAMGEAWGGGLRSIMERSPEPVGPRLTLELEVAGEPTPLLGRTIASAATRLRPGIDGIAMRRGERWAMAFPGRMLASNTAGNPVGAIGALAAELGLPARDLPELRQADDVALYRMKTLRLVQLAPGEPPVTLVRNDELVPDAAVTREATAQLAGAIAHRLVRAVHRPTPGDAPELFLGDYRPVSDQRRPAIAPPFEQALASLALLRLAGSGELEESFGASAAGVVGEARNTALLVLERLASGEGAAANAFADRRAAAAAALAVLEVPAEERAPWLSQLLEWAMTQVLDGFDPRAGFVGSDGVPLPGHSQALLAHAVVVGLGDASNVTLDQAIAAVDAAWASVPEGQRAALLPWIAMAESELSPVSPGRDRERLLALREALLAAQIGFQEAPSQETTPDLRGAFALTGTDAVADSQSIRPAAGLGAMLNDERLTPAPVRDALLARQKAAVRYVMQLTVRPPLERLYRRPEAVLSGVRESTWDSDQTVAAQAMALLALTETLRGWPAPPSTPGDGIEEPVEAEEGSSGAIPTGDRP